MIGSIKGILELKDPPYIIVDVHGVGYRILSPGKVSSKLNVGDQVKFFTYTYVREDILDLYGFESLDELKLFQKLISVSGIGPKTAVTIFSFGSKSEIINAVLKGDVEFFTSVPRLGKKNAQKIIIELKGKLGSTEDLDLTENTKETDEVISALKLFGFSTHEAREALNRVKGQGESVEEKVKLALRELGK